MKNMQTVNRLQRVLIGPNIRLKKSEQLSVFGAFTDGNFSYVFLKTAGVEN